MRWGHSLGADIKTFIANIVGNRLSDLTCRSLKEADYVATELIIFETYTKFLSSIPNILR